MKLEQQVADCFGLPGVTARRLHTPVNDVIAIMTSAGDHYALKLYNNQSRTDTDVQWELELITHLIRNGAPVAKPVGGRHGYVETLHIDGQRRVAALFEWAPGKKPTASHDTYVLLGDAAARIHHAADTFASPLPRETYDARTLIDEQLERMQPFLLEASRWQQASELGTRLKRLITTPALDRGVCHMDLTLDNIHRDGDALTVFDFDSAGECWRAYEPYGVLRFSKDYFQDWLTGYRSVRPFSEVDERAVRAFAIIGDMRNTTWKLGAAKSSRGEPLLKASDLPEVVDGWLAWERHNL